MDEEGSTILIDVGSGFVKAGFDSEEMPSCIFPCLVGRPRRRYTSLYPGQPSFVGMDGVRLRQHLSFFHPVDHGHVGDWLDMEDIWSHIYMQELEVDNPAEHSVLATVPPRTSRQHKENLLEAFFESHEAPEVSLAVQGHLALYSYGRTTGLVVEIGEGVTQVVPTIHGWMDSHSTQRTDFGGVELTMYLQKLLCDRGYALTTRDDFEFCRAIKEKLAYVASNPTEEGENDNDAEWTLPDGLSLRSGHTSISLGNERFFAAEPLFEPHIIQRECPALTEQIWACVNSVALDHRKEMLEAVVLSGGTTLLPGLKERLAKELRLTAPEQARGVVRVSGHEGEARLYGAWTGAKVFSKQGIRDAVKDQWVTRDEWDEHGASLLLKKLRF